MKLEDFFDKVDESENLEGVAIIPPSEKEKHKGLLMVHSTAGNGLTTSLPVEAVEQEGITWEEHLYPILIGEREPRVLFHITRVVGYFSRVENWNDSKQGELKDRHVGNYALPTA